MPQHSTHVSLNTVNATARLINQGRCALTAIRSFNLTAAVAFVQIFDAAAISDVTVGSTIPVWVIEAVASGVSPGDGLPDDGMIFNNGIVIASTTTHNGSSGASQHVTAAIT